MYLDYFSIARHPFRITPDTSLFFSGGDEGRGVVLDAMLYAIQNGEGILKVVGEVGSGKTMLCRMLEERLPDTTEVVYLANPKLSPEEILYAVAFELKLPVRHETPRLLVMQQLQDYLLQQHAANRRVLVTIEEAQSMPFETLEEIRLLSNLETKRDKLMQIILFGQPELDRTLAAKNIRQLRERITHSFYLDPLTPREVAEYIRFRLGTAGCPCPRLLTGQAERLIARASGGLVRRINILSDKALLAAYSDNVLKRRRRVTPGMAPVIRRKHVMAAIGDSDYKLPFLPLLFTPLRLVSASMVVILTALGFLLWPQSGSIAGPDRLAQQFRQLVAAVYSGERNGIKREQRPLPSAPALLPLSAPAEEAVAAVQPVAATGVAIPAESEQDSVAEVDVDAAAATATDAVIESSALVSRNLARDRILASIDWLQESDRAGYTVQFITDDMGNLKFAETMLGVLDRAGLLEDSYLCISQDNDRSYWTIKYGNFPSLSPALEFVEKLPAVMHEFEPFVQNMSVVECNTNPTIAALILE